MAERVSLSSIKFRSEILQAAQAGAVRDVAAMLREGADPNTIEQGYTPLLVSVATGDDELVEVLVEHGANPNVLDPDDEMPLMTLIANGGISMAGELLNHGADVNMANSYGVTPLFYAVSLGSIRVVDLLVRHGADVHHRSKVGNTVLDAVYRARNHDVAIHLLALGCRLEDAKGYLEGGKSRADFVEWFEKNAPAVHAVESGDIEQAMRLLDGGVSPEVRNTQDGRKPTLLMLASERGDREMVRLLLSHGADVNAVAEQPLHYSVLMMAVRGGDAMILGDLIAAGADIYYRTEDGMDAVMMARKLNRSEAVGFLESVRHG